jgi:uncharacterized membrane protein (UPF0127 family)
MKVYFRKREIEIPVKKAGSFGKIFGLMFKGRRCENLLFDFGKNGRVAIHSLFVFFPFLAVWLDEKDRVVDFRIVSPFEFNVFPKKRFSKLIEIPENSKNRKIIDFFVGKRKV